MRAIVVALLAAALGAAVLVLRAATMSTHEPAPAGSRTEVVISVSTRGEEPSATVSELAYALVVTCRLEVNGELTEDRLHELGDDRYRFALTPALDDSDRRQLHGCLEDALIDHMQAAVTEVESFGPGEGSAAG